MEEVSRQQGRTVLFVRHNLAAVAEMADRGLLLQGGSVSVDGSVSEAISNYLSGHSLDTSYVSQLCRQHSYPHIVRVDVLTSERNGVQHFGSPMEVKLLIAHAGPVARTYLAFQIINQFQQPVVHAFDPEVDFGSRSGCSLLVCRFPNLRLNVGRFYLRVFLAEAPGGDGYDTLDVICHFEVVRSDRNILWGWRPEACAYHEQYTWSATTATGKVDS